MLTDALLSARVFVRGSVDLYNFDRYGANAHLPGEKSVKAERDAGKDHQAAQQASAGATPNNNKIGNHSDQTQKGRKHQGELVDCNNVGDKTVGAGHGNTLIAKPAEDTEVLQKGAIAMPVIRGSVALQ